MTKEVMTSSPNELLYAILRVEGKWKIPETLDHTMLTLTFIGYSFSLFMIFGNDGKHHMIKNVWYNSPLGLRLCDIIT